MWACSHWHYFSATSSGVWNVWILVALGFTVLCVEICRAFSIFSYTPSHSPVSVFSSPLSTVHKVPFNPVTDLSVLERRDSHGYIEVLRCPVSLHPLMPRKDTYHLPLPLPAPPIPHAGVDSWATGTGLCVAVLVQQVGRFLTSPTEPVHQLTRAVVIKSWEVDSSTRQPLSRGADS